MDRVNIWFWNYKRNNGDAIASHILRRVVGVEPVFADREHEEHVLPIGSVMAHATGKSFIWGAGVLDPKDGSGVVEPSRVRAVRGRLTQQWLRERGVSIPDVPLGDPGIFADRLLSHDGIATVRAAIVPHHDDSGFAARFAGRDDVRVVSMLDDSLAPLAQIASAEVVVSESLHGLVYAEALGVPSVWVSRRRDSVWSFKFRDWYSTTRHPQATPLPLDADLDTLAAAARRADSTIDRAALLQAFPYGAAAPRRTGALVGFEQCRAIGVLVGAIAESPFHGPRDALSVTDAEIETLQWRFVAAMRQLLANWAQPVYLCLYHGLPPRNELVRAAMAHLDHDTRCEFAVIRDRGAGDPASAIDTCSTVLDGALVLRPVGWFSPRKPFATVFTT